MFTHREFDNICIDLSGCTIPELCNIEMLIDICKKFGDRLKTFKIWCSVQSEIVKLPEKQLIRLLEVIPEIENLELKNIMFTMEGLTQRHTHQGELNLTKLSKFVCDYCSFDTPVIFIKIPRDTITDLVFTFEPRDVEVFQEFFNRQSKIQKLVLFENEELCIDHLSLEYLKISSNHNFLKIIQNQPKLKSIDFAISWVNAEVFEEVCKLKNLEVLKTLIDMVTCSKFRNLGNGKLKELRIDSHDPCDRGYFQQLSSMDLKELEKITLIFPERCLSVENIVNLAMNLKKLKTIQIVNRSINIITFILEHYPQLEILHVDFCIGPKDDLIIEEGFKHDELKELIVTNISMSQGENTSALLKLLRVCPNLEKIKLSYLSELTFEQMKEIFQSHPRLTHIYIYSEYDFDIDIIEVIKRSRKLQYLRFGGITNTISYSELKENFQEDFPNINLLKYLSSGESFLELRKRNIGDWFNEHNLMQHF
jgi:hypothetical protein